MTRLLTRAIFALVLMTGAALAQSAILQGGPWTSGHMPMYSAPGGGQPVVQDSGPAGGGAIGYGLSEFLQISRGSGSAPYADSGTGPYGTHGCLYDGPTTGAYHYLCLDANAQGGPLLAAGYGGGATPLPLSFIINGTTMNFPASGLITPPLRFYTAGAPVDQKYWQINSDANGQPLFQLINDSLLTPSTIFTVTRTGSTPTSVVFVPTVTANISFLQSGTGAVATTVDAKLKSLEYNALDYGVVVNSAGSAAANCAALNNALAAIDSVSGGTGGVLRLPPGDIYTSCTIDNKFQGILVEGWVRDIFHDVTAPNCGTRLLPTFAGTVVKHRTPYATGAAIFSGGGFKDICINGNAIGTRLLEVDSVRAGTYSMYLKDSVGTEAALFKSCVTGTDLGEACDIQDAYIDIFVRQLGAGAPLAADGVVFSGSTNANVSFNQNVSIRGQICNGSMMNIVNADNNFITANAFIPGGGTCPSGRNITCRGGTATQPGGCRHNIFKLFGGASYAEGTGDPGVTTAVTNLVSYLDTGNGTPDPTAGTGSRWIVQYRNSGATRGSGIVQTGLALGSAETNAANARDALTTESLIIDNGSSNHMRLINSAGAIWGMDINAATDDFRMWRLGGSGKFTVIGPMVTTASVAAAAGINIPHGTAPTSPVNGDFWSTTTAFFARVNGATKTLANLEDAQTFALAQTFTTAPKFSSLTGYVYAHGGTGATAATTIPSADFADGNTGTGAVAHAGSPAFTGNPTAPTQAANDNSTKLATTAYADAIATGASGTYARKTVIQTFTSSGTYTPTDAANLKVANVIAFGAGGGGGGGALQAAGAACSGGAAGGGGARTFGWFSAAQIGASQSVTIGAAGTGGAAQTGAGALAGNNGTAGGATAFGAGNLLVANGGGFGAGGQLAGNSGGGAGAAGGVAGANGSGGTGGTGILGGGSGGSGAAGANSSFPGAGAGGAGGPNAAAGTQGGGTVDAASGGGSGGGITAANATANGGAGGTLWNQLRNGGTAGVAGGAKNGGNGTSVANGAGPLNQPGAGGGGGASDVTAAGNGGAGGIGGGGGGGGGCAQTGGTSGTGGAGAAGYLVVIENY